ncbi:hypothetical protein NQ317_011997 [Molorchus minor]|uniref:Gag protein n=1 Tax=Molorchus minor TaxID=1323400 RepID=A0ABQ9JAH9_9CUCU|nr:hypothetical protein NQ317_011997 [Molorchus minor]
MADIDVKRKQRTTLRAAVTNRSRDVEEVISGKSVPEIDLDELQVTWDVLREKYDELKVVSAEVFDLLLERDANEDDLAQDMELCDVYTKKFKTIDFKCAKIFKERNPQSPGPPSLPTATRSVVSGEDELQRKGRRKFKLPEIQFKKFDGNIRDWLPFWAQFKKVHDDPNIDPADKVDYLVQATLPGSRARQLVDSFPATGEHYPQIIESLQTRFGREDIQIEVYVRELLKLILNNAINKNKIEISRLYDQIETQLRSLETLGITSDKYAAMLFPLIESCLPEELLRIWQRSVVSLCADRDNSDLEDAVSVAGAAATSANTISGQRSSDSGRTPVIRLGAKDSNITLEKRLNALMQFLRNEVENEQRVSLASESFGFRELSQSNDMANSRKKSPKVGGSSKISTAADLVNAETKKCVFCDSAHESAECFKAQSFPITKKKRHNEREKGVLSVSENRTFGEKM